MNVFITSVPDLEILNVESVWLEFRLKSKRVLVGTV